MKPRDPDKINKIFDATLDIVSKEGLAGLTMAKVSSISDLGMGTIYNYFQNKEDIIYELFISLENKLSENIYAELVDGDPFIINLKRIFTSYFMVRWENERELKFIDQYRTSGYMTEDAETHEEALYSRAYEIIEQGKKELIIKYVDNRFLLTNTTFELCRSVILK